jgi:hypothetical protein
MRDWLREFLIRIDRAMVNARWTRWLGRRPAIWRAAHAGAALWLTGEVLLAGGALWLAGSWLQAISVLLAMTVLIIVVLASAAHVGSLCERCAQRTPLDAAAEVARRNWELKFFHKPKRAVLTFLGVMMGSYTLILALSAPDVVRRGAMLLVGIFIALEIHTNLTHRILYPWCPYCRRRWDEGGDEEPSPTPDPSGTSTPQAA